MSTPGSSTITAGQQSTLASKRTANALCLSYGTLACAPRWNKRKANGPHRGRVQELLGGFGVETFDQFGEVFIAVFPSVRWTVHSPPAKLAGAISRTQYSPR